jgi:hypothetical protein
LATIYQLLAGLVASLQSFDKREVRGQFGGDVTWNSEAGQVSGKVIKVHTKMLTTKGTPPRQQDEPQYEIKSDKTDHIAMHKGAALRRSR